MPGVEHRPNKSVNNLAENSRQPIRERQGILNRFRKAWPLRRFVFIHDPIANLFQLPRHEIRSAEFCELRTTASDAWRDIANLRAARTSQTDPVGYFAVP